MFVVLAQLVRPGHDFPLGNPLLQVVHLPAQHEELEGLVQSAAALHGEVPQTRIQLVNLRLSDADLLAAS